MQRLRLLLSTFKKWHRRVPLQVGGEGDIVQQTAGGGCDQNKKEVGVLFKPARPDFRKAFITWTGFVDKSLLIEAKNKSNDLGGGSDENKKQVIFIPESTDFSKVVLWTGFVDKTLLIEELISRDDEPKCVIILAPRRSGKSLNMDMVKRFFEIEPSRLNNVSKPPQDLKELEKYENYQAFKRYGQTPKCKILNNVEFVKEYFGRHPVVHLDFKTVKIESIQSAEDSLRALVRKAYRQHDYLKDGKIFSNPSTNEEANETCRNWCDDEKYLKKDPIDGLETLIEYLHAYHKRKVYFLVDEFDAPATKALLGGKSGNNVKKISRQVTRILGSIVKGEIANQHLLGSLITGVSYLSGIGISDDLNNVTVYKWLLNDRFAPYYGLQDDELTPLLEHVFPNDEDLQKSVHSEVKDLYNGYFFKGKCIYSFWSVLHYIKRRSTLKRSEIEEISFWGDSSIIIEMCWLLNNTDIMKKMIHLMRGGHVSFKPYKKVSAQTLADFLNGKNFNPRFLFTFFMEQGYLSHIREQNENTSTNDNEKKENVCNEADDNEKTESVSNKGEINAKIPNRDVYVAYEQMLMDFCVESGLNDSVMTTCGEIFKNLHINCHKPEKCKQLIKKLRTKLKELLSAFECKGGINETTIQAILYVTMLKAGFKNCNCEHRIYSEDGNFGKIDLYMREGNYVIIFEIKYVRKGGEATQNSSYWALKEILGESTKKVAYTEILDGEKKAEYYLLAGLAVNEKCEPYMCCLFNNSIIDNCFNVGPEN